MISPVSRSQCLHNFFHLKSKKLSADDQKKYKNLHIIIGFTTFGLGHAFLGIAYLIEKSCLKTSKIKNAFKSQIHPETPSEECLRHLNEGIYHCIAYFEHESNLENLESVSILKMIDGERHRDHYNAGEDFARNRENFLKFIEEKILEREKSLSLFKTHPRISISFMMTATEDSQTITVKSHLFYHDGKFVRETGPQIQRR